MGMHGSCVIQIVLHAFSIRSLTFKTELSELFEEIWGLPHIICFDNKSWVQAYYGAHQMGNNIP